MHTKHVHAPSGATPAVRPASRSDAVHGAIRHEDDCIVIQGFADLGHFLSWYHIKTPLQAVFPRRRHCRRPRPSKPEAIVIRGFDNLAHFLDWLDAGSGRPK